MSVTSVASYVWGNCTWFVAKTLSWVPAGLGNASDWLSNAQRKGYKTSNTPTVGSVVVYGPGHGYDPHFGHVAVVSSVQGPDRFTVKEMNAKGLGIEDTRSSSMADVMGFILPPKTAQQTTGGGTPAGNNPAASFITALITALDKAKNVSGQVTAAPGALASSAGDTAKQAAGGLINWPDWFNVGIARSTVTRAALVTVGLIFIIIGVVMLFAPATKDAVQTAGEAAPLLA